MGRFACALVLAGAAGGAGNAAHAGLFCREPSKPYCLTGSGYFDDQLEFERCKFEVESYIDNMRRYTACLTDEINEAVRGSNEAIEQFNCHAEGRNFC